MRVLLLTVLLCIPAYGQPTPVPIRFPTNVPAPVVPVPTPEPNAVTKLTADTLYVIDCDVPCLILASPAGLVTVSEETGPLKIRGRFVDGNGKAETRTYSGKVVATIEAVSSGRVEILVIPVGVSTVADVQRRTIDVDAGEGPRPPPQPPEPPTPPVPQPIVGARVMLVYESTDPYSRETLNTIHSTKLRELLSAKCGKDPDGRPAWRVWDKDVDASNESQTWRDALAAVKPSLGKLPALVIFNGKDGKAYPLPETEAATLEFLTKTLGGS